MRRRLRRPRSFGRAGAAEDGTDRDWSITERTGKRQKRLQGTGAAKGAVAADGREGRSPAREAWPVDASTALVCSFLKQAPEPEQGSKAKRRISWQTICEGSPHPFLRSRSGSQAKDKFRNLTKTGFAGLGLPLDVITKLHNLGKGSTKVRRKLRTDSLPCSGDRHVGEGVGGQGSQPSTPAGTRRNAQTRRQKVGRGHGRQASRASKVASPARKVGTRWGLGIGVGRSSARSDRGTQGGTHRPGPTASLARLHTATST